MKPRSTVIQQQDAARIHEILTHFLRESGAAEALLIDRGGQLMAMDGGSPTLDAVSISALAAAAFSSTAAMAQLLGEPEFTVLYHEGTRRSIHVSTVDDEAIMVAIFDERTTVGMVRLFGAEASRAVGAVLGEARARPKPAEFAAPLNDTESRPAWTPPS
ncbi:MAG: roadblock/LC7 domain-containing protein [Candidatus Rokuibacteriota bacterium]